MTLVPVHRRCSAHLVGGGRALRGDDAMGVVAFKRLRVVRAATSSTSRWRGDPGDRHNEAELGGVGGSQGRISSPSRIRRFDLIKRRWRCLPASNGPRRHARQTPLAPPVRRHKRRLDGVGLPLRHVVGRRGKRQGGWATPRKRGGGGGGSGSGGGGGGGETPPSILRLSDVPGGGRKSSTNKLRIEEYSPRDGGGGGSGSGGGSSTRSPDAEAGRPPPPPRRRGRARRRRRRRCVR